MANYSYETLQRMSAHQWEGLKPGQRKAVRNFNRKEGASEPDMLEAERILEEHPNLSMDEALNTSTNPSYRKAKADTDRRIAETHVTAKTSKPAKTEKPKKGVAELVGEALNAKPADASTGPDWQWIDSLPDALRAGYRAGRLRVARRSDARQSRHVDQDARLRPL